MRVKILIVEDEPKTGEYLRQGLSEAGYVADLVPHGTDGLHMALHGAYDLVVLDVMLPGLNGWQVLQSLRERGLHLATMLRDDRLHIRQPQANARNRPAAGGCQAATYCFAVARHAIRLEKTPTAVVATPVALLPISTCLLRNAPEGMRPCSTSM